MIPVGFAVIVVVGVVTTLSSATARLTTPAVLGLAIIGLALSLPLRRHLDGWAVLSAVAVYAVYAAPVVLSGSATFAGYIKLDDTSTWFGLTDHVLAHGRSVAGLAPSSYQAYLRFFLHGSSYPVGSFIPLGIGHTLVGEDIAWLFQPYVSLLAAMLGLAIYSLLGGLVVSRPLRAAAAFVAAQPALLYGYALWGGVKEVATAFLIVLLAALLPPLLGERINARGLVPLVVAAAGLIGVLSGVAAGFIAPVVAPALFVVLLRHRRKLSARAALRLGVLTAVGIAAVAGAVLAGGVVKINSLTGGGGGNPDFLGNLFRPLDPLQLFGIWPNGDFRFGPRDWAATVVLIAVLIASAALGLGVAIRRRNWPPVFYVCGTALACVVIVALTTPWVDAKTLAIASPAFLVASTAGAALVFQRGRRVEAAVLAAAIAGGVLWSNVLAYREVWLAPRDELTELQTIGHRFAGDGPALVTEYQLYGVKHFLRQLDPVGVATYARQILLRTGAPVLPEGYADLDELQLGQLLHYRTLVVDRSPFASRPPAAYSLVWRGRYYEVWQRTATALPILEHLPLGTPTQPGVVPPCSDVLRIAARAAGAGGLVAAVIRPQVTVVPLAPGAAVVLPYQAATYTGVFTVPRPGRYDVWLGGSFPGGLEAFVDGVRIGTARHRLSLAGRYLPLGQALLADGDHSFVLRYSGPDLQPGSAARVPFGMGPLALSPADSNLQITEVPPADARSLCGNRLDWVEAIG